MAIALSGSLILSGSITVSGSIISTGTISMSGSIASASYALNATTGAYANTSTSASYALNATTFNGLASSIFATTGSNTFIGTQTITGSVLQSGSFTTTGTIIAQTINVQQVTSSIVYSCGSNIFGTSISNTQQLTGSVGITGSLTIAGASSATSYNGATIFGSTIACSPIGCFATSCATSFIGGTMSGTTIYGSTAVCSPVGKFTSCVTAASLRIDNNSNLIGNGRRIFGNDDATNYYIGDIGGGGALDINWYGAIKLMTAYGEVMRITSAGNVGIGTCTPTGTYGKLSVAGGISILNDNNAKLQIGRYSNIATDSYIVMASGSTGLTFTNAGDIADVMRITTCGNVGIGTNSPSGTDITLNVRGISGYTTSMVIAESYDAGSMVSLYSGASSGDDPSLIYLKALRFGSGNKSTAGYVERMRITCGGVVKVKNTTIPEGDDVGLIQVENTTAAAGSGANAGITVKSYNGTAQIMQWENKGIRLGNRIKTNTGEGAVYFTYGNDTIGMTLTSAGHVTKPCSAAFHAAINTSTCIGQTPRVIQFNCVFYNAGGGYDGTTSTFTAPVSGMYQFNFTFLSQNTQSTTGGHMYLSTNYGVGTYYFTRYGCQAGDHSTGYGGYVPMHGAIAIYLPSGYKACVAAFWDAEGAFTHNSTAWSNFTGYLVG